MVPEAALQLMRALEAAAEAMLVPRHGRHEALEQQELPQQLLGAGAGLHATLWARARGAILEQQVGADGLLPRWRAAELAASVAQSVVRRGRRWRAWC